MQNRMYNLLEAFYEFIVSTNYWDDTVNKETLECNIARAKLFISTIQEISETAQKLSLQYSNEYGKKTQEIYEKMKNMDSFIDVKPEESDDPDIGINTPYAETDVTLLTTAIEKGKTHIVKLLLDGNADPNNNGYDADPLLTHSEPLLTHSLSLIEKNYREPTYENEMIAKSQPDILRLLLEAKADLCNAYEYQSPFGYFNCVDADIQIMLGNASSNPNKPLKYAIRYGNMPLVQLLLDKKADPDYTSQNDSWTPIRTAVSANHVDIVHYLLSLPTKRPSKAINEAYESAIEKKNLKIIKLLLEYGAFISKPLELKGILDDCSQDDPDILFCLNALCRRENEVEHNKLNEKDFQPIKKYREKLEYVHILFKKEVGHEIKVGIPCYMPKELINIIQEYDVPLEGRIKFKPKEIDKYLTKRCTIL